MNPFIDSTALRDDVAALREVFDDQGYVLVRSVIDGDVVARAAEQCLDAFKAAGAVGAAATLGAFEVPDHQLHHNEIDDRVDRAGFWHSPSIAGFLAGLVGGPIEFSSDDDRIRYTAVGDEDFQSPAHQDGFYLEHGAEVGADGVPSFRTVWTPLLPSGDVGGVTLAATSHRDGLRPHRPDPSHLSFLNRQPVVCVHDVDVPEQYHFGPMAPGDVLVFHPHLVHRSVPNQRPGTMRLSMDTRFFPVGAAPLRLKDDEFRRAREAELAARGGAAS